MSYCPNCGNKFDTGKFRCPNCGALLVYGAAGNKPSLWNKLAGYRNLAILLVLAIAIVLLGAARALNIVYWVFIIGIIAALAVLWLRGRNRTMQGKRYSPPNRYGSSGPQRRFDTTSRPNDHKKASNVIPFRKKKGDTKSKAKQDR